MNFLVPDNTKKPVSSSTNNTTRQLIQALKDKRLAKLKEINKILGRKKK